MPVRMVARPAADKWAIRINEGSEQVLYEADSHEEAMEYVLRVTNHLAGWRPHGVDEFVSDGEPPQRTITLYPPIPLPEPMEMPTGRRRDGHRLVSYRPWASVNDTSLTRLERQAEQRTHGTHSVRRGG